MLLLLAACGARVAEPVHRLDVPQRDAAAQLAALLPGGASACGVARVASVSERRRPLLSELAEQPFAWEAGFPATALAHASRRDHAGHEVELVLARVDDVSAAKRWLVDDARVRIRWVDEDPCATASRECRRWHARALDARTVLIARGAWPSEQARGVARRCTELTHRRGDAVAVTVRRQGLGVVVDDLSTPFDAPGIDRVVVTSLEGGGVRWEEQLSVPTELPLEVLEVLLETRENSRAAVTALAAYRRTRRTPEGITTAARVRFEDLELAREDAERMRNARMAAERARDPLPVDSVDVTDRALLDRQLTLRRARAERADAGAAREQTVAMRTLLERAVEAHPDDAELVGALVRLLTELGEGEEAARRASRMLDAAIGDPEHWRQWRRRALAQVGPDALRDALREDGVARGPDAAAAAEMLVGHVARYEAAEAAWIASRTFARVGPRPARIAPTPLPAEACFETLLTAMGIEGLARSLHVLIRTDAPLASRVEGPAEAPLVSWPETRRGVRVGASTLTAPDGLRAFGVELVRGLPEGARFELTIAILPFGGDPARPDATLRARGRVGGGSIIVDAIATAPARVLRWERVPRYLAEPLAQLEARLFPPPDLEVEFDTEAEVETLLERARAEDAALDCVSRGLRVRCQTTPDRDVARRAWARVVEPWIVAPVRTTTRP